LFAFQPVIKKADLVVARFFGIKRVVVRSGVYAQFFIL
jgi:hypothetical protein